MKSDILQRSKHIACTYWESSSQGTLVLQSPRVGDLLDQAEAIEALGYTLVGGVQIRREGGEFWGSATFIAPQTGIRKT